VGAETSSTVTGESESTPHKNKSKASVQDSAKNKKIKKLVSPFKLDLYQFHLCHVCFSVLHTRFPPKGKSRIQLTEDDVVAFFFSFDGTLISHQNSFSTCLTHQMG
jgi:hypothetical protein